MLKIVNKRYIKYSSSISKVILVIGNEIGDRNII